MGARRFLIVPSERSRGNGCKLKYRKLNLNIGKKNYGKHDQTLEQVAQRGCENIHLWIFQNLTTEGPGQPALAGPALSREGGLDNHVKLLPTSAVL